MQGAKVLLDLQITESQIDLGRILKLEFEMLAPVHAKFNEGGPAPLGPIQPKWDPISPSPSPSPSPATPKLEKAPVPG